MVGSMKGSRLFYCLGNALWLAPFLAENDRRHTPVSHGVRWIRQRFRKNPWWRWRWIVLFSRRQWTACRSAQPPRKKRPAMILFRDAVAMVDQSPALSQRSNQAEQVKRELGLFENEFIFRPISRWWAIRASSPLCADRWNHEQK